MSRACQHGAVALLSESEIEARLGDLPGWSLGEGSEISKTFACGDFVGSVDFVGRIVEPAEDMNHHPDIEISWDKVLVKLSTHAEGGLTAADFDLAEKIEAL